MAPLYSDLLNRVHKTTTPEREALIANWSQRIGQNLELQEEFHERLQIFDKDQLTRELNIPSTAADNYCKTYVILDIFQEKKYSEKE